MFTKHRGFNYILFPNDTISRYISSGKEWESHMIKCMETLIKPHFNCLDIGANFGYHTLEMSKLAYNGNIHSFEPQIENNVLLCLNKKNNNCNNVKIYLNACGDLYTKNTRLPILNILNTDYIINMGDLSLNKINDMYHTVETITIDSLNLLNINFIKIDVQGFELFCLKGMETVLKVDNPIIVVEFEDKEMERFGLKSKSIYDYLKSMNYNLYLLDANYSCDYLCIHDNNLSDFKKKYKNKITKNDKIENKICSSINGLIEEKIIF